MCAIQGSCELILGQPDIGEKTHHHALRISRAVNEMGEISSALLALAREQGEASRSAGDCQVMDVVNEVVERYRELYRNKPVELRLEVIEAPDLCVDHAILFMVLGNLIRNALSFTEQGEVRIKLNQTNLLIEDTGPGLGEKNPSELFRSYVRGSQSPGAGLGLSLVHRLCEHQGWRITLNNRPGGGTVAELDLRAQ